MAKKSESKFRDEMDPAADACQRIGPCVYDLTTSGLPEPPHGAETLQETVKAETLQETAPSDEIDRISSALMAHWNRRLSETTTLALLAAGVHSDAVENAIDRIRDYYEGATAAAFEKEAVLRRHLLEGIPIEKLLESRQGGGIVDHSSRVGVWLLLLAMIPTLFGCATANDKAKRVLVSEGETWSHVRDAHEEAGKLLYLAGKDCQDAVKAKGGTDLPMVTAANVGAVMAQCKDAGKPLPFDPVKYNGMADVLSKAKGAIWQGNELRQKVANANGDMGPVWQAIADAVAYLAQTYLIGKELGFSLEQGDLVSLQKAAAKR